MDGFSGTTQAPEKGYEIWYIRSLCGAGSVKTEARELGKYTTWKTKA
jgi:hypothetical protein